MWFSVVCTLIYNDMRHHSYQNVVDLWAAIKPLLNRTANVPVIHLLTGDFSMSVVRIKKKSFRISALITPSRPRTNSKHRINMSVAPKEKIKAQPLKQIFHISKFWGISCRFSVVRRAEWGVSPEWLPTLTSIKGHLPLPTHTAEDNYTFWKKLLAKLNINQPKLLIINWRINQDESYPLK